MIIDTHTHVVPDRIAPVVERKTAEHFASAGMKLHGPMTIAGLLAAMDRCGIDRSAVFCVAEKPAVVRAANDFLAQHRANKRFILMGSIHPDTEDPKEEIDRLRRAGFKGVKFHSLFQDFYPDEERMLRIYPLL